MALLGRPRVRISYLDPKSTAYILPYRVRRALWIVNLCLLLGGAVVLVEHLG